MKIEKWPSLNKNVPHDLISGKKRRRRRRKRSHLVSLLFAAPTIHNVFCLQLFPLLCDGVWFLIECPFLTLPREFYLMRRELSIFNQQLGNWIASQSLDGLDWWIFHGKRQEWRLCLLLFCRINATSTITACSRLFLLVISPDRAMFSGLSVVVPLPQNIIIDLYVRTNHSWPHKTLPPESVVLWLLVASHLFFPGPVFALSFSPVPRVLDYD